MTSILGFGVLFGLVILSLCSRSSRRPSGVTPVRRRPDVGAAVWPRQEAPRKKKPRPVGGRMGSCVAKSFSSKIVRAMEAPEEKDGHLRCFSVVNPEGEIFSVDTRVPGLFHGPVWTRILDAYEKGEFLRARAVFRQTSRTNGFSGYTLSVDGVPVFLPRSRSFYFYDGEKDATKRCLAVKIETIHTNGPRMGTVIADAWAAWAVVRGGLYALRSGREVHALAMDIEEGQLIFPAPNHRRILVPIAAAREVALGAGLKGSDDFLTGIYWRLRLLSGDEDVWQAEPLEILI